MGYVLCITFHYWILIKRGRRERDGWKIIEGVWGGGKYVFSEGGFICVVMVIYIIHSMRLFFFFWKDKGRMGRGKKRE